jgi:hypothetical protein
MWEIFAFGASIPELPNVESIKKVISEHKATQSKTKLFFLPIS